MGGFFLKKGIYNNIFVLFLLFEVLSLYQSSNLYKIKKINTYIIIDYNLIKVYIFFFTFPSIYKSKDIDTHLYPIIDICEFHYLITNHIIYM